MKVVLALATLAVLALPGVLRADVNLCMYNGTATLNYVCKETDLDCEDISLGLIIRDCTDLVVAPGPGLGSEAVVFDTHPDLDGQPVIGNPIFQGEAMVGINPLSGFRVMRDIMNTLDAGQGMQAMATDATGAIYAAEFVAAGLDQRGANDLMTTATPGGQTVRHPVNNEPMTRVAAGDFTVSVFVVTKDTQGVATNILAEFHTDFTFDALSWQFISSGPVANESTSWGQLKAAQ